MSKGLVALVCLLWAQPVLATDLPPCQNGHSVCGVDAAGLPEAPNLRPPLIPAAPRLGDRGAMKEDHPDWAYYADAMDAYPDMFACLLESGGYDWSDAKSLEAHEICLFRIAEATDGPAEMAAWLLANGVGPVASGDPSLMMSRPLIASGDDGLTTLSGCFNTGVGAQLLGLFTGTVPLWVHVRFDPEGRLLNVAIEEC